MGYLPFGKVGILHLMIRIDEAEQWWAESKIFRDRRRRPAVCLEALDPNVLSGALGVPGVPTELQFNKACLAERGHH